MLSIHYTDDMMPILARVAGFPIGTQLVMYEEVKPNLIEKIEFTDGLLEKELDELMDGDILIVQRDEPSLVEYKKPTPKEYSRYIVQIDISEYRCSFYCGKCIASID